MSIVAKQARDWIEQESKSKRRRKDDIISAARVEIVTIEEDKGSMLIAIGGKDQFNLLFADDTLYVHAESTGLLDWVMSVNEKLEAAVSDSPASLDTALRICATTYTKLMKAPTTASTADEPSSDDDEADYDGAHHSLSEIPELRADDTIEREDVRVHKAMQKLHSGERTLQTVSSVHATDRLLKEYRAIIKTGSEGFQAELEEDNLYEWNVKCFGFDAQSPIAGDLAKYREKFGLDHVLLRVKFTQDYPLSPPFVHIVRPRVQGGFVHEGGSFCMELLTTQGWSSAYSLEMVIPQIMAAISDGGARIPLVESKDYLESTARSMFARLARHHEKAGWGERGKA